MKLWRVAVLAAVLPAVLPSAEARLLRHPSYHKGKVAFSYLGDIWVANETGSGVERLTVHRAREVYPRFSPDGRWIAFSSNRNGNYDVFVMPARGGTPRQLTFHTGADTVVGWTPDSQRILFTAARGRLFSGVPNLYEIPADGGLEQLIETDWGYWGSYSPDGKKLAFNRHGATWWRKHYRGSRAADIWLMDVTAKSFRRLSDPEFKGNSVWPMYAASGDIYFVSDRLANEKNIQPGSTEVLQSANNIWKISERGGQPVKVTQHQSGAVFFPSISGDGRVIVYEADFGLWKLDTATGKASQIQIEVASDEKENNFEILTIQGETDGYSLSPSGRRAAVSAHGEIFTIATDRGEPQRVTESYWRDASPLWSPDGKWIAFVSDRSGRDEVWIADEFGKNLKQLSDLDTEKPSLTWAPDSKSLLYTSSDHKLYRVETAGGKTEVVVSSEVSTIQAPRFSPDGQWFSYTKLHPDQRPHVYIVAASGGQQRPIGGQELFSESNARWTPDGKKLLFLSGVSQQGMASVGQNPQTQLYSLSLVKEEKDPVERDVDSEAEAPAEQPAGGRPRPGQPAETRQVEVKIDWDRLDRRARRLTRLNGSVLAVEPSPDSRTYAFVAMAEQEGRISSALYTIQENGERLTRLAGSQPPADSEEGPPRRGGGFFGGISSPQFSRDGRTLYYQERNGLYSVAAPAGGAASEGGPPSPAGPAAASGLGSLRGSGGRRVNFTVRVEVDHRAEWKQVFHESWRVMKNRFYDSKMHGVDWAKARAAHEPLLEYVADQEEMHNLVSQMIGELNASHTGISAGPGGGEGRGGRTETRFPGFEVEPDSSGYLRVSRIYKNGPADKDYVKLAPGDYVLAIEDHPLKSGDNYWKYYNSTQGRRMEFTVNSKPSLDGAWKIKVEPVSSQGHNTLLYERWVSERKAMVEELSGGEVGYLHIRAMNQESLRKFERDLVDNKFKKALIIDQRFNGGGGIDQELLQILNQRQYQRTQVRDSVDVTRPLRAYFGPMVVMQNENSGSDAEMFPDGFRALGLGKLVGVNTYGGVIGTGSHRLMDGSQIRTPMVGVWSTRGYNLENYGVPPDIYIDNTPEDFLAGRDAQLKKAVEVLREEIRRKK